MLEEIFSANSLQVESTVNDSSTSDKTPDSVEDDKETSIFGLKSMLRSNPSRIDNFRMKIKHIVDQGLGKLKRREMVDHDNGPLDPKESEKGLKRAKDWRAARALSLSDLVDKLNKARNEEDLKSCLEVKSRIFNDANDLESKSDTSYSYPKLITKSEIDRETLEAVNAHFSSVERIVNL